MKDPIVILDDKIAGFDCDDTLVMWTETPADYQPGEGKIAIVDPYKTTPSGDPIYIYLTPHKKHIQKLKGYSKSGWFVIVWSMGGGAWAKNVADALGITNKASLIIGKPSIIYDDMPLAEAFGQRKYMQDKKKKKSPPDII